MVAVPNFFAPCFARGELCTLAKLPERILLAIHFFFAFDPIGSGRRASETVCEVEGLIHIQLRARVSCPSGVQHLAPCGLASVCGMQWWERLRVFGARIPHSVLVSRVASGTSTASPCLWYILLSTRSRPDTSDLEPCCTCGGISRSSVLDTRVGGLFIAAPRFHRMFWKLVCELVTAALMQPVVWALTPLSHGVPPEQVIIFF